MTEEKPIAKIVKGKTLADLDQSIPENIPCKDFQEAIDKGIIQRECVFELWGKAYFTFANDLQMICANRYLAYQQAIQQWSTFGMSMEVSKDYINDALDNLKEMRDNVDDRDILIEKIEMASRTLQVYNEHQKNFNLVEAIIELNAVSFITPNENPYQISWDLNIKKIADWEKALTSEEGAEFLTFFWKLSSRKDQSWMHSLVESMKHLVKPLEQMNQQEIEAKAKSESLLAWDISMHKKHLEDLLTSKNLKNHAKQSRTISNLLKLKWNSLAYSITSSIRN